MDTPNTPENKKPNNEEDKAKENKTESESSKSDKKTKKKKLVWLLLFLLLLLLAGIAGWLFANKDKKEASSAQSAEESSSEAATETKDDDVEVVAKKYVVDKVVYEFKANTDSPFIIYTRPAAGGDRTERQKLGVAETIYDADVQQQVVAFTRNNNELWVSSNGGETFSKVVSTSGDTYISRPKISFDGTKIAYGENATGDLKLKIVNVDGSSAQTVYTDSKKPAYVEGWNATVNKMVLRRAECYQCDAPWGPFEVYDLSAKTYTAVTGQESYLVGAVAVSDDLSKIVYRLSTEDKAMAEDTGLLGYYVGPPYKVQLVDVASKAVSTLATFGEKGQKDSGAWYDPLTFVGFLKQATGGMPYYAVEKALKVVENGKETAYFEGTQTIVTVPYASDEVIFVGTGKTTDYSFQRYDQATKTAAKIFAGDGNTVIFGVTTKAQ